MMPPMCSWSGILGRGRVEFDERPHVLSPGRALLLARGPRRSITAETRLLYLTCHRRQPRTYSPEELLGRADTGGC